jgi:hypothetical protein
LPDQFQVASQENLIMAEAVILDMVRTATGRDKPGEALFGTSQTDLLAMTLWALVERNGLTGAVSTPPWGAVTARLRRGANTRRTAQRQSDSINQVFSHLTQWIGSS